MTPNRKSERTLARRSLVGMAAALATVAMAAAGVAGQGPLIQPEPVEPPIVEPTEIGPGSNKERTPPSSSSRDAMFLEQLERRDTRQRAAALQTSAGVGVATSPELMARLDNTYLRGIAADWHIDDPARPSAEAERLSCVEGPSRTPTPC